MKHSTHNIISGGANATRYCPECNADWRGSPIPEEYPKAGYYAKNAPSHYSYLIGVEIRGKYDGVDHWQCPDCNSTFNR